MRHVLLSTAVSVACLGSAWGAELVSVLPNGSAFAPGGGVLSVSDDGRFALFPGAVSRDANDPNNYLEPLYVRDRTSKSTKPITSRQAAYFYPAVISGDGSTIISVSGSTDTGVVGLAWFRRDGTAYPDDAQGNAVQYPAASGVKSLDATFNGDTIVYSSSPAQQRWRTYVQSRSHISTQGVDASVKVTADDYSCAISSDGRWVVDPNGFVVTDTGGFASDVMELVNLSNGQRTLLPGEQVFWDASPTEGAISGHGEAVAYIDTTPDGTFGVVVYDRASKTAARVDRSAAGVEGNGNVGTPSLSTDGVMVGFISNATNLVHGVTDGNWHAYVVNRLTQAIRMVSVSASGAPVQASGRISGDGRFVIGYSSDPNVDPAYPTVRGGAYLFAVAAGRQ